jgi:hypothetical protein
VQVAAGIVTLRLGLDGQPMIGEDAHPVMIAKMARTIFGTFFASWLINELRCNPNNVKTLVGHSSIKLTYDIYGHLFDDDDGDNLAFAAGSERVMSAPLAAQASSTGREQGAVGTRGNQGGRQKLDKAGRVWKRRRPKRLKTLKGRMAEWLCSGLQIRVQRFDSASGLHR